MAQKDEIKKKEKEHRLHQTPSLNRTKSTVHPSVSWEGQSSTSNYSTLAKKKHKKNLQKKEWEEVCFQLEHSPTWQPQWKESGFRES